MKDTLTAPLSELAHVKTDDLRHVVRPVSRSPLKRIASMGLGLLAWNCGGHDRMASHAALRRRLVTQSSDAAAIDSIQRRAAGDPRVTGLAGGLPAEAQFPKRALAQSFLRALSQAGAPALQYGWVEGSEKLRALVARRLRARGAAIRDDEVIITNGAQQAIAIALELLTQAGDHVGVDAETYPAALELMRARRRIPIAGAGKVRLIYAMPR